jgi:hypothetical protein
LQDYNEKGKSGTQNVPTDNDIPKYDDILELKRSLLTQWKDSGKKNENEFNAGVNFYPTIPNDKKEYDRMLRFMKDELKQSPASNMKELLKEEINNLSDGDKQLFINGVIDNLSNDHIIELFIINSKHNFSNGCVANYTADLRLKGGIQAAYTALYTALYKEVDTNIKTRQNNIIVLNSNAPADLFSKPLPKYSPSLAVPDQNTSPSSIQQKKPYFRPWGEGETGQELVTQTMFYSNFKKDLLNRYINSGEQQNQLTTNHNRRKQSNPCRIDTNLKYRNI